jgi:hypothetical protein
MGDEKAMSDPREVIEAGAMGTRQWIAVAMTIGLNALDGFDVLSSAFAGPGIKKEWNLAPDGLGAVLSMELIGMGVGSPRAGRNRPTSSVAVRRCCSAWC